MTNSFKEVGFLSSENTDIIAVIRAENTGWFSLIEEINAALMTIVDKSMIDTKTTSMDPKAVAVRVLLRACSTLQGAILLIERGMIIEARTLARSLIEDAFCIAALLQERQ